MRILLSLFLVYHLIAVVLLPNPYSVVGRVFTPLFTTYASTLGMNTTWQFFSPNPMPHRYLSYTFSSSETAEEADKVIEGEDEDHYWPPRDRSQIWRENYNRQVYHSVVTTVLRDKTPTHLIPWLCQRHPGAVSISLYAHAKQLPSIERAKIEGKSIAEMAEIQDMNLGEFSCPGDEASEEEEP